MTYDELKRINTRINALPYKAEVKDDWRPLDASGGDCDSYATAKFRALVELGWHAPLLRLATCWVETGGYRAVLLADLDDQTWCLDNRHPHPVEYQLLPYKWHKLQIAGTRQWEFA